MAYDDSEDWRQVRNQIYRLETELTTAREEIERLRADAEIARLARADELRRLAAAPDEARGK